MPTTFANTIDGNDIYAARAVADKDGNQLDTTYAKSASLSTVATTGDYDDLSNKPTIPAALTAGDGISITNNIISAKVDGTTIVVDSQTGELSSVPSTSNKFYSPAYGEAADKSLTTLRNGPSLHYTNIPFDFYGIALTYLSYSQIPLMGRTLDARLSNFVRTTGHVLLVTSVDTSSLTVYPVWFPCSDDASGFLTPFSSSVYIKGKTPLSFTYTNVGQYNYNLDGTRDNNFNNPMHFSVQSPLSATLDIDTSAYDKIGDWSTITTPPIDKWALTFVDSNNNYNVLGATNYENTLARDNSQLAVKFGLKYLEVKCWENHGLEVNPGAGLYIKNPVPDSTSTDEGKVLRVNSSGTAEWASSGPSGVQDVEVNGTSVVNAQGVAEVTVPAQVNADWNAASGVAEILNKPSDLVQDANYVHTDENFTSAEKTKLSGIATGAEVNVQADWNESNSSSDAYIQNKPTIPAAQVNADWNASSGVAEILNKPTILPYKPVVAGTGVRIVDDTQNNRIVVEADETVLWTGDSGAIIDSTNGSVLLSETAMNFEKIRIYAQGSALNSGGATIDVTIGSTSPLSFIPVSLTYTNDGSTMFTDCCVVQFDGTSFKYKLGFRISVSATTDLSRQSNRGLKIVKVVGVNRIASN